MKSSTFSPGAPVSPAPGRPGEVEEATNRYLVHPVSRALVDVLVKTKATPNQVSVGSVAAAAGAGLAIWMLPGLWAAVGALIGLFFWHVLDGADGDLARRTGRASVSGELVDGVCDHVSQIIVYAAMALVLQRTWHGWAWAWALTAGGSHFLQANAYETGRKSYRRWVYDALWMRQGFAGANAVQRAVGGLYVGLSNLANPGDRKVEAAMQTALATDRIAPRWFYQDTYQPLVKRSAILSSNTRTLAVCTGLAAGSPVWFFAFECVALNLALVGLLAWRMRCDTILVAGLPVQAASAPN